MPVRQAQGPEPVEGQATIGHRVQARSYKLSENHPDLEGGALGGPAEPPKTRAALTAQRPPPDIAAGFPDSLDKGIRFHP